MSTNTLETGDVQILTGSAAIAVGESGKETRSGFFRSPQRPADFHAKVKEAAEIVQSALTGSYYGMGRLQEAMSTDDFPHYLGNVLDRELLPAYQAIEPVWPTYVRRTTVRDFRPKKFVDLLGGDEVLERVGQLAPYPAGKLTDRPHELTVGKFGRRIPLSFEAIVNDDLGDFSTIPQRLAQAARNTEDFTVTGLYATETGPSAEFFSTENGNAAEAKPLNLENLSAAITTVTSRKDPQGNPIVFPTLVLIVPPALQVQAQNLLNATEIETTEGNRKIKVRNWLSGQVRVVVNPWLTIVDRSEKANSTWYLFPESNSARPGLVAGFLRGREIPDLRVKADQGTAVGGGPISPAEGSFDNDSTDYRVRHILGGTTLDPIGTYASTGS